MKGRRVCAVLGAAAAFACVALPAFPALAKSGDVQDAIETAFEACHEWVTNPDTWADDIAGFPKAAGLKGDMEHVQTLPNFALPPGDLQQGAIYWHIPAGKDDLYLAVSVSQPVCRIAGGGPDDWQPSVEKVLASRSFRANWEQGVDQANAGVRLTQYASKSEDGFSMIVTRADAAGGEIKQLQFLATARLR